VIFLARVKEIAAESIREWERISAHSHITGLGLDGLKAKPVADGMVGQIEAREAAGLVVRLIKQGKFGGRAVLLVGPVGSGKTALANGIAKELGKDVPFVQLAASEIFSTDIRKTEFLTQTLRKAIGARIHEIRKVYEGVIKELEVEKAAHPYNPYQQIPVGAKIKIATKDQSKTLKVDQSFAIQIYQQGIESGDIVQIDPELGRIVKLGKSEEAVKEKGYDITREKALPIPSGDVLKEKEFVYPVTLHSLDLAFARETGSDIFSLFFGGKESKEIEPEIRQQVDEYIKELVQEGKCELLPGVVFIDEVSMLDIETFAFLNRAMEQELCPILIFATNRGITSVRGTDIVSPHGIPLDLLDRLLIINTKPYTKEEIRKILEIRAEKEKVKIEKEALDYLTQIGEKTSLRHAIQLLAPAYEVAKENKREKISVEDIKFIEERFVDVKKSVEYMKSLEEKFLK
jgi:TBP-interacting protein